MLMPTYIYIYIYNYIKNNLYIYVPGQNPVLSLHRHDTVTERKRKRIDAINVLEFETLSFFCLFSVTLYRSDGHTL